MGFNAGNYHGVEAVLKGHRCAVALWFTMDPAYQEQSHIVAHNILTQLETRPFGPGQHPHAEL